MRVWCAIAGGCLLAALAGCGAKPLVVSAPEAGAAAPSAPASRTARTRAQPTERAAPLDPDNNIFFKSGDAQLDPEDLQKLQRHAQRLKDDPKLLVTLVGHADDQGSRSYQLARAEQRLEAVFQALRRMGVPVRQLKRYPVGREKIGSDCNAADCRDDMRRVELLYRE